MWWKVIDKIFLICTMCNTMYRFGPVEGCMPLAITGSLPKFWDWLSNASDAGKSQYMSSVVEVWAGKDNVSTLNFMNGTV